MLRQTASVQPSSTHQAMSIEHLGNRAARRPFILPTVGLQPPFELLGAPRWMLRLQLKYRQLDLFSDRIRMMVRRPTPVLEELWVNLGDDGLREAAYRGG
jgi:hypothetical protein